MVRAIVLACVALAAACISSDSVVCDDGRVCAAGTRCHRIELPPAEVVCVTPDELHLCEGRADYARCGEGGRCYFGACLPGGCGNARRDLSDPAAAAGGDNFDEACDDGNTAPGDGCSADCRSDETCRNGVLDAPAEQCDDANGLSHDGCSSACAAEPAAWTPLEPIDLQRIGYALAYDARRERVLLFGGELPLVLVPVPFGDTLEWDGRRWRQLPTPVAPSARTGAVMAYDAARDRIIIYGGRAAGLLGDTWEWDGAAWSARPSAHAPPARTGAVMAYDPRRQRTVLFGGERTLPDGTFEVLGDTWEWDGADWAPRTGAAPPARRAAAMAFDARRGAIVLFGGRGEPLLADTWALDGAGWRPIAAASPPPPRWRHAMAADPVTGQVVVAGGSEVTESALPFGAGFGAGFAIDGGAWRLEGDAWVQRVGAPMALEQHALAPYPPRGALVTVGPGGETLEAIAEAWTVRGAHSFVRAPPLRGHAAALDPFEQRAIFVGSSGPQLSGETWLWDGQWRAFPGASPPPRTEAAAAFDQVRREVVLFGGYGPSGAQAALGDTWVFDGAAWTERAAPGSPSPRFGAALAFDAARGVVLLFGGADATGPFEDTLAWDGAQWAPASPTVRPPARSHAAMAYDPRHRETVMFGGRGAAGALGDTWLWRGGAWIEAAPGAGPPPRGAAGMAFDPARGRVVLYGGHTGASALSDAWEWDGAAWAPVSISVPIAGRSEHALVPAPGGDGLLVFGGALSEGAGTVIVDHLLRLGRGASPSEDRCVRVDTDGDGLAACADPDCWARCTPACPPAADPAAPECATAPRCGDGACSPLESCSLCPGDCGPCAASCGDLRCEPGETAAACPGDCPGP